MGRLRDLTKTISSPLKGLALWLTPATAFSKPQSTSKSSEYAKSRYQALLARKGCFMDESHYGINEPSEGLCQQLLNSPQDPPKNTLFSNASFDKVCDNLDSKNEAKIVQDISRLIVPSVEALAVHGAEHLDILVETVNESWVKSIPVTKSCPHPSYAVGFRPESFTDDQCNKLRPFIGEENGGSYIMATGKMFLPFLTCETKSNAACLLVADKQNMHSMMLAVRGVVTLFRAVNREKELHQQIIAFSVSHNGETVHIYGHYAEIDGPRTTYYRHEIVNFAFRCPCGRDKWLAYQVVKNIYDLWVPDHFQKLRSVVDALPAPSGHQTPDSGCELRTVAARPHKAAIRMNQLISPPCVGL